MTPRWRLMATPCCCSRDVLSLASSLRRNCCSCTAAFHQLLPSPWTTDKEEGNEANDGEHAARRCDDSLRVQTVHRVMVTKCA
eukprot:4964617-Amphidinium_carterae.1